MADQLIPFDIAKQKEAAKKSLGDVSLSTLQLSAAEIQVADEESYQQCIALRNKFASAEKKVMDFWEPIASSANKVHKMITKARAEMVKPWADGKDSCTKKAEEFLLEQKRAKREAEQALAEANAREQEAIIREGEDLIAQGFVRAGRAKLAEAQAPQVVSLPSAVPFAENARVGDKFTGSCQDIVRLLKAIVDGKTPLMWGVRGEMRPLVTVDPVVLKAIVDRHGMEAEKILPGVAVEEGVRIGANRL